MYILYTISQVDAKLFIIPTTLLTLIRCDVLHHNYCTMAAPRTFTMSITSSAGPPQTLHPYIHICTSPNTPIHNQFHYDDADNNNNYYYYYHYRMMTDVLCPVLIIEIVFTVVDQSFLSKIYFVNLNIKNNYIHRCMFYNTYCEDFHLIRPN